MVGKGTRLPVVVIVDGSPGIVSSEVRVLYCGGDVTVLIMVVTDPEMVVTWVMTSQGVVDAGIIGTTTGEVMTSGEGEDVGAEDVGSTGEML
jgi:hypothetical protein